MWDRMGRSEVPAPTLDLADRFAQRLTGWQSTVVRPRSRGGLIAAVIALLLIGGIGGFTAGRWRATAPLTTSEPPPASHLLLLYGDGDAPGLTDAQLIAEYVRWARELEREGRLVEAHRLLDPLQRVEPGDAGPAIMPATNAGSDAVSGFFLIRANDMEHALALALEGPHARYGGRIEIRPVAP
jgi:hypothetical protein